MTTHAVVLVPGFFGFEALGDLRYFAGVREALGRSFEARGHHVKVFEVSSLPTASVRYRAAAVLEKVSDVIESTDGPVHIVGHSTGGLDARLVLAPTASLPSERSQRRVLDRVDAVVSISTPHLGTPLASFFAGAAGKPLLRLFATSMALLLQYGHLPIRAVLALGELMIKADNVIGLERTTMDEIYAQLLSDFTQERRDEIRKLLDDVASDQALIFQLTPASVDMLNAATADPEAVRYGCVVTESKPPGVNGAWQIGRDVYAQALHGLFTALYFLAGRADPPPDLRPTQAQALERFLGHVPGTKDNDGIVPSRAQIWGEVIYAVSADHLDVVGHYPSKERAMNIDWLPSANGFDDEAFDACWDAIAGFLTAPQRGDRQDERGLPAIRKGNRE